MSVQTFFFVLALLALMREVGSNVILDTVVVVVALVLVWLWSIFRGYDLS